MKITLETTDSLQHYVAKNEAGHEVFLSGDGTAAGPMQAILMAIAGCSTIDVIMILEKMRQGVTNVKVEVDGKRREEIPRTYTNVHLHFKIYGEVKDKKAEQAVALSIEKYCSVSKMIEKSAEITTSYEIIAE